MNRGTGLYLALVGTESLRGKELKNALDKTNLPIKDIDFFDTGIEEEYSKLTEFRGEPKVIHSLDEKFVEAADLVFLASDKGTNKKFGDLAKKKKFRAIDLNETFNAEENIPVVVAGVNDRILKEKKHYLVGNPHPITVILSHLFYPVFDEFRLKKAIAMALEPASAFEESGMGELASQSVDMLNSVSLTKKIFKEQTAFNFLCQLQPCDTDGFSPMEKQIRSEIQRVLDDKNFPLSLSVVQAPVFHTYSIMTYLELEKNLSLKELENIYKKSPYFKLSPSSKKSPISSISTAGDDKILIGQIKKEESFPNSFWIWIAADNLTRGSALNALEIAETISSL